MPSWLNCPRCNLAREADDERLTRAVHCEQCGALLWQGNHAGLTGPPDVEQSPPPVCKLRLMPAETNPAEPAAPRPAVVYVEPECSGPPLVPILCTLLVLMGLGYIAFVGVMSAKSSRAAAAKYTTKTSVPPNTKPPPATRPPSSREPARPPEPESKFEVQPSPPSSPDLPTRQAADPPRPPAPEKSRMPDGRPSATREGVDWEIRDLTSYLQSRGLTFTQADRMGTTVGVWLVARSKQSVESLMVTKYDSPAAALVALRKDPPKAGYRSFTWGTFLVWAEDCPFYRRLRAELPAE